MKSALVLVIAANILAGCASGRRVATFEVPPYDEAEYAALAKVGTGVIKGQVFAKTVGGEVKRGAGENVVLFPATRYGEVRYREQVIGGKFAATAEDPRYRQHVLQKMTDGDGRFEFKDIPPGTYYILSRVVWEVPTYNRYIGTTLESQGGKVVRRIEVKNDTVTDVILNYN